MPIPPSFYEQDMEQKYGKYEKAIKERQAFKAKYLKDHDMSIAQGSKIADHVNQTYTGGKLSPVSSEFARVVKKRRSRNSVHAPVTVDFDHVGNTS